MTPINEVQFERIYDAPIEKVWRAWTDPEELKKWWGPDNVIIPECEIDLRVGGKFYIVMEATQAMGPYQGARWPTEGTFSLIENGVRLAYSGKAWTEGKREETEIEQNFDLSLEQVNDMTKITVKITIIKAGPNSSMAVQGLKVGLKQQLDKLIEFLINSK